MKKNILVVEDNQTTLKFFIHTLESQGHRIFSADDGISALNILSSITPDIIFIDLIRPKNGGNALIQTIREMPRLKDCFLVVVFGKTDNMEVYLTKIGADMYIAKAPLNDLAEQVLTAVKASGSPSRKTSQDSAPDMESSDGFSLSGKQAENHDLSQTADKHIHVHTAPSPQKTIRNILFVDDEEPIRQLYKGALEKFGYKVMLASNGNEAMNIFLNNPTDLIITDIFMPEQNGHAFILEVKQRFPEIKIFAITGTKFLGPEMELEIAKTFGATRVFTKPCKLSVILNAIKELSIEDERYLFAKKEKISQVGLRAFNKMQTPATLIGAVVAALIVLISAINIGAKNTIDQKQVRTIESRLNQLETTIERAERIYISTANHALQDKSVKQFMKRIEKVEAALSAKIANFTKALDQFNKTVPQKILPPKATTISDKKKGA